MLVVAPLLLILATVDKDDDDDADVSDVGGRGVATWRKWRTPFKRMNALPSESYKICDAGEEAFLLLSVLFVLFDEFVAVEGGGGGGGGGSLKVSLEVVETFG